jgi:hypothetical protein
MRDFDGLAQLAVRLPWVGKGELELVDSLALPGLERPLWLLFGRAGGGLHAFAVCVQADGTLVDVTAERAYQSDFLAQLARQSCLRASAGGQIVYQGAGDCDFRHPEIVVADRGGSSNCVTRLRLGAVTAMHKVYRKLDPANHELDASRCLGAGSEPLSPRFLGGYWYVDTQGVRYPMGVLTEFFEGRGLHADLSASIRAMYRSLREPGAEGKLGELVSRHLGPLLGDLVGWRAFLGACHSRFDQHFGTGTRHAPAFDWNSWCDAARARIAGLRPQVLADDLLPAAQAQRIAHILDGVEHEVFSPSRDEATRLVASACHGDLHLSHLMWRTGASTERRLIDLSPLAASAEDPAYRNSSKLLDWAAIERAIEYFCLDETALELTLDAGVDQERTMQRLMLARLDPRRYRVSDRAPGPVARARAAFAEWHGAVLVALCGTHANGLARNRFYCARLLQELEYNYAYRRPYYRCIDLAFLVHHFSHLDRG